MHRPVHPPKLFVLVRGDLPPGLQYAQAVHAAVEYALAYPDSTRATPNAVVLNVLDEDDLLLYAGLNPKGGIVFREPDRGGEATAYATIVDDGRFQGLPLAGREFAMQ